MSFWNRTSNFHLNHNRGQPLLTHEKAFYLDTVHPATRDYVTPTRLFPVIKRQAKTTAEMRQEIADAWQDACTRCAEREREQEHERQALLWDQYDRSQQTAAQLKKEEDRQRREYERLMAERLKDGRVFSEIVSLMQGYTVDQISADPKLKSYFLERLPDLLSRNAERISLLQNMLQGAS